MAGIRGIGLAEVSPHFRGETRRSVPVLEQRSKLFGIRHAQADDIARIFRSLFTTVVSSLGWWRRLATDALVMLGQI